MENLGQLLVSNVAAITTAGGFLWYLVKRDRLMQKKDENHNVIITNHLNHSNTVIKENSDSRRELAVEIKGLAGIIKSNGKTNI